MEEEMKFPVGRVNGVAVALLGRLEQAVKELDAVVATHREKVKTETGEEVTEFEQKLPRKKGVVDRGGLKQLTGVLKELEDIFLRCPQLDAQEQMARIAKLEKELHQQEQLPEITVRLEGDMESYAQ